MIKVLNVFPLLIKKGRRISLKNLMVKNSPVINNTHFKHKLVEKGYLKNQCHWCGLPPIWRGLPLTLELDHVNGDSKDNRLENLRILCLNCHSQTETFRRRKSIKKQNFPTFKEKDGIN